MDEALDRLPGGRQKQVATRCDSRTTQNTTKSYLLLYHPLEEYVDLCFLKTILQNGDDLSEKAMSHSKLD
jgi:hypothetical protein